MVKSDKSVVLNSTVVISVLLILIPPLALHSAEAKIVPLKSDDINLKKISELGKQTSSCPFHLSKNEMPGRVPSIFYEIKCLTCHHCDKKSGNKCMQLTTMLDTWNATSLEKMEPIHIKVIFNIFSP